MFNKALIDSTWKMIIYNNKMESVMLAEGNKGE